jgi:hypothetical protein
LPGDIVLLLTNGIKEHVLTHTSFPGYLLAPSGTGKLPFSTHPAHKSSHHRSNHVEADAELDEIAPGLRSRPHVLAVRR